MSANRTKFPKSTVPARKIHQATTIVGKNGLPIDALATIEPGSTIIASNNTIVAYSAPTVTFDNSIDLSDMVNFTSQDAEHTGILLFTDSENMDYFVDPASINNTTKTLDIYIDADFTTAPVEISTEEGWFTSEAELVNRLQTTTSAVIDSIEFRDVDIKLDLDGSKGDSVKIVDSENDQLEINEDGSINSIVTATDLDIRDLDHTQDSISIGDGTDLLNINNDGSINSIRNHYKVMSNQVTGLRVDNIFGRNKDVDLNVIETVWNVGGVYLPPTSAAVLAFSSTNALDTAAGTGAQEITFVGLDSNYDEITESVATNGTSTVNTTAQFLRLNKAFVSVAGSSGGAVADITISLSGADIGKIEPILNKTIQAVYTTPANKRGYLLGGSASITPSARASGTKTGEVLLTAGVAGTPSVASVITSLSTSGSGVVITDNDWPLFFDEKTDIIVLFLGNQNNAAVNVDFQILLEDI